MGRSRAAAAPQQLHRELDVGKRVAHVVGHQVTDGFRGAVEALERSLQLRVLVVSIGVVGLCSV